MITHNFQGETILASSALYDKLSILGWVFAVMATQPIYTLLSDMEIFILGLGLHNIFIGLIIIGLIVYQEYEPKLDDKTLQKNLEKINADTGSCIIPVLVSLSFVSEFGDYCYDIQFQHCGTFKKVKRTCCEPCASDYFIFPDVKNGQWKREVQMKLIYNKSNPNHYYLLHLEG